MHVCPDRHENAEAQIRGRRGTEIFLIATFKDTTIPALARYVRNLSKPEVRLFYVAPVLILVFAAPGVVEECDFRRLIYNR
jgi:hypothetical protein